MGGSWPQCPTPQEDLTRMALWHHPACRWGLPAAISSGIYVTFGTWLLCSSAPGPLSFSQPLLPCLLKEELGFPGGAVVKNLPANAGDTGSSPGPGRSHMPRSN